MRKINSSRNNSIDILRFISCLFIVFIHCPLQGTLGECVITVGRYAVPLFLLVSGWFVYVGNKDAQEKKVCKKIKDTLRLIGSIAVFYVIVNSLCSTLRGEGLFEWIKQYCTIKTALFFLICNRAMFFGSTGYYPFMLLYVYIIFMILVRSSRLREAIYAVPFLLAANVFLGLCTDIPWIYYGNFLFTGIPFFLMGYWLHSIEENLPRSNRIWILFFVTGIASSFAEAILFGPAYCYAGTILSAISILVLAVRNDISIERQTVIRFLRRMSVLVFVVHCGIKDILDVLLEMEKITLSVAVSPWIVLICSLVVGIVWYVIESFYERIRSI